MTDFHESLDRALDEEHPYAWTPPADRSIVESWPVIGYVDEVHEFKLEDLRPLMDKVNRDIANMIAHTNAYSFPITRWTDGQGGWLDDEPVAHDGFGAPLYAHQIPAEGTE